MGGTIAELLAGEPEGDDAIDDDVFFIGIGTSSEPSPSRADVWARVKSSSSTRPSGGAFLTVNVTTDPGGP